MNTITKISTGSKGVYRHAETGFTIHDISSVTEAIEMNGVLACDMTKGTWAWVAGEDLFVEVYKRGGSSLRLLAQKLLSVRYQAGYRMSVGVWYNSLKVGPNNTGSFNMHGLTRESWTYGADIRLFGIVTNAQAGRGCHLDHLNFWIKGNTPSQIGCTVGSTMDGFGNEPTAPSFNSIPGVGGADIEFVPRATVIGRVIIAIPLQSWEIFLAKWADSMPNKDKSEVQGVITSAIAKFSDAFKTNLFTVPSVRIPLVLTADGKAMLDGNPTWSATKVSGQQYAIRRYTCLPYCPTLIDSDGWWITNPICAAPGIAHNMLTESFNGLDGNFFNTSGVEGNKTGSAHTVAYTQMTSVDGVDLFKILGGLYPRVDTTPLNKTSATLISMAFGQNHGDSAPPIQLGNETGDAYNARMTTLLPTLKATAETSNWGHWNLAGQPAVLGSILLDAAINDKAVDGINAFTMTSGNLCSLLRGPTRAVHTEWTTANLMTNPAPYLRHQYA